jgi:sortase A
MEFKKPDQEYMRILTLRTVGNFFILASLLGVFLTFWPVIETEVKYRVSLIRGETFIVEGDILATPTPGQNFNNLLVKPTPETIVPVDREFGIVIPKINANVKVIPEVDAGNYNEYMAALKQGVAHAKGTVYPGMVGNSFLFAHSVGNFWEVNRYNAVFYLLKELNTGDLIVMFWHNKRYDYVVTDKKTVDPTEVGYLNSVANYPMLTLQTCWPPGTTLKRLLVFAKLKV